MPKARAFIARTIDAAGRLGREPMRGAWRRAAVTRRPRRLDGGA
jgi:hypothetical protein